MAKSAAGATAQRQVQIMGDGTERPKGSSGDPVVMVLSQNKLRLQETYVPPAPGATIHASIAGGAPLAVSTGFTRIIPATNVRLARGAAGSVTVYTLTGTRFGVVQSEQIASNGASNVESTKVYDTVTSLTSDVDPGTTTTVQTGTQIGLPDVVDSLDFLAVAATSGSNAVVEAATLNPAKDGFTPTTTPDGTKVFRIRAVVMPATAQP